uniref:Uncharacterized protein n=1 Tax=Rhodnius prolixus TaxID=13249 RepID=T1ICU1_RHOPR
METVFIKVEDIFNNEQDNFLDENTEAFMEETDVEDSGSTYNEEELIVPVEVPLIEKISNKCSATVYNCTKFVNFNGKPNHCNEYDNIWSLHENVLLQTSGNLCYYNEWDHNYFLMPVYIILHFRDSKMILKR